MSTGIVIASCVRTAVGKFGGSLREVPAHTLAATVIKEVLQRAAVAPEEVGEVVFGCVGQVGKDAYIARSASLSAGLPVGVTAYTVNRLCSSGIQAVWSGVQSLLCGAVTGGVEMVVAGGVENMSRIPFYLPNARWGYRLGHDRVEDGVVSVLSDPLAGYHMGITAENLVERYNISRAEQDQFALESHAKAVRAQAAGVFDAQIVPVVPPGRGGVAKDPFARDEQPRADSSLEKLASLRPVFKEEGSVTAGNAAPINDGAAACLLTTAKAAARQGLSPLGEVVGAGVAGVEPEMMGYGPVPSTRELLERLGLDWDDIDLVELNEAFAGQALAVLKAWPNDVRDRTNVSGGAIALGHPIGATGAVLLTKALYDLRRLDKRYALVTMCVGGGQGFSMVVERV